ncbi:hypothetical protein BY996DRAFT_6423438 [Phakopsora pachyrhizi]|nr:hypothetical protein BY996DRAFT_6423438 [Phakopsora pachyrhizi]
MELQLLGIINYVKDEVEGLSGYGTSSSVNQPLVDVKPKLEVLRGATGREKTKIKKEIYTDLNNFSNNVLNHDNKILIRQRVRQDDFDTMERKQRLVNKSVENAKRKIAKI